MGAFLRAAGGFSGNAVNATIDALSGGGKVGDVRYVFTAANTNAFGAASMQGWTQLVNATIANGMVGLWWKPLVANEPTVSINYNFTCDLVLIVCSLAAASTTGTPQSATNSGTSTTLSAPSITPTSANSVELAFYSTQVGTAAVTSMTLSTPSGMTSNGTWLPPTGANTGVAGMLASTGLGNSVAATGTENSTASTSGTWRTATVVHPPGPVAAAGPAGQFSTFFGGGF